MSGRNSEGREEIGALVGATAVTAALLCPADPLWEVALGTLPSPLRSLPSSGSRDTPVFLYVSPPSLLPHAPLLSLPSPGSPPLVSRDEVRAGGAAAAAAAVEVTEAVAAEAAPSAVLAPVRPKSR